MADMRRKGIAGTAISARPGRPAGLNVLLKGFDSPGVIRANGLGIVFLNRFDHFNITCVPELLDLNTQVAGVVSFLLAKGRFSHCRSPPDQEERQPA